VLDVTRPARLAPRRRLPATLYQLSSAALLLRTVFDRPLSRTFMPLLQGEAGLGKG
jgi:hypothetical protein